MIDKGQKKAETKEIMSDKTSSKYNFGPCSPECSIILTVLKLSAIVMFVIKFCWTKFEISIHKILN